MSARDGRSAGPLPVKQARGRETLDRLVRAAVEVVSERGVGGASVPEITDRAGTSVGNFYRRFPGKEALLDHLEREFLAGRPEVWEELLRPARWRQRQPRELLEVVVGQIVDRHAEHRDLLRAIALRARGDYERRVGESGTRLPARLLELIETTWPGAITHSDAALAVRMGLEMVSATAGEVLLFRQMQGPPSPEVLTRELTRAWAAYLGLAPAARTGARGGS